MCFYLFFEILLAVEGLETEGAEDIEIRLDEQRKKEMDSLANTAEKAAIPDDEKKLEMKDFEEDGKDVSSPDETACNFFIFQSFFLPPPSASKIFQES